MAPKGQSSFYGSFSGPNNQVEPSFLATIVQLIAHPLMQFHRELQHSCMLTEGMDQTLRLGYSLQFCCVPPLFIESQRKIYLSIPHLSTDLKYLLQLSLLLDTPLRHASKNLPCRYQIPKSPHCSLWLETSVIYRTIHLSFLLSPLLLAYCCST